MKRRICVITAGHLSTCPRMLKAADALAEAGYAVRLVSARFVPWACIADVEVRRERSDLWNWSEVNYDNASTQGKFLRIFSGIRSRSSKMLAKGLGPGKCPLSIVASAYNRVYPEMVRSALAEPVDLFYAGTGGALAVASEAARRSGVPYALDLEDFHTAEQEGNPFEHLLIGKIEEAVLSGAAFVTAGSEAIVEAYKDRYGISPIPINNTFPLPSEAPVSVINPGRGLNLYWFSQTIGPGRGLDDVVAAMGLAGILGELHLRGRAVPAYLESLRAFADKSAPRLAIIHHETASPDLMVDLCKPYDVGLALEQPLVINRRLCLTNKAFTYMLAGLAVIFTDTPGQRPLAMDIGDGAFLYQPGDIRTLAEGLKRWAEDKNLLLKAKNAAWEAASRRWHWEHPKERGSLLQAVEEVLNR